jgi:hypothetical protein
MVKGNIIKILSDSNIYQVSKVMSLVFKSNEIEQELNFEFIVKYI